MDAECARRLSEISLKRSPNGFKCLIKACARKGEALLGAQAGPTLDMQQVRR